MLVKGNVELDWFVGQREGRFFKEIADDFFEVRSTNSDSEVLIPSVALDFTEYVAHRFKSAKRGPEKHPELLHIAVAECSFDTGIQDADHEYTIRFLVGLGYPIDMHNNIVFRFIDPIWTLETASDMTHLAQVLVERTASDEIRLQLARNLLDLGAKANIQIRSSTTREITNCFRCSLLRFCVCHQRPPLVRLLPQHGADPNILCTGRDLLHTAYIRQDASVVEAFLDAGIGPSNWEDILDDPPSVRDALILTGHVAASSVGDSLPTGVFSLGKRDTELQHLRPRNARSKPDRTIEAP